MPSMAHLGNYNAYRILPTIDRRPAPNEPGSLRQQITAINTFLDALEPGMSVTAKERLKSICHSLATDQPIRYSVTNGGRS